jgi:4-amino-4-deoxy-L-arabinose transferase-like glycosyltransferase
MSPRSVGHPGALSRDPPAQRLGRSSTRWLARETPKEAAALALVLAAGALLIFFALGARDLWPPDEPRYGAIAEELRSFEHGARGLVLLHQNGAVYTQKPPLYFWLAALAGAPGGRVTEFAARLPSALAGLGTLLCVAWLGRSLFRPRTGVLAAAVLLGVQSWIQQARSARLDALLTFFVSAAFVAAWRIDRGLGDPRRNRLLLHGAIGLGILTKGPVALLLPLLGVLAYLAWERRLPAFSRFVSGGGLLLSLGPGLSWWAGAAVLAPRGYAGASLWDNLAGRFFLGTAHASPVWYYLEALPRACLPWTLLWPAAWWRHRTLARGGASGAEQRAWRFLFASIAAAFVFFSISAGKRSVYLLPIHPLLAVASAEVVAGWVRAGADVPRWLRVSVPLAAGLAALAGLACLASGGVAPLESPARFGVLLAAGPLAALLLERALRVQTTEREARVAAGFCVLFAIELAVYGGLHPALDARNSPRAVAAAAAAATAPGEPIGVYRNDTLAAGIHYYARHPVRDLHEPRDVADFVRQGGTTLVVDERRLAETGGATGWREVARARIRQRLFHVLSPAD